jgi:hypothetical protein
MPFVKIAIMYILFLLLNVNLVYANCSQQGASEKRNCDLFYKMNRKLINWAYLHADNPKSIQIVRGGKQITPNSAAFELKNGDIITGSGPAEIKGSIPGAIKFFKDFKVQISIEKKDNQNFLSLTNFNGFIKCVVRGCVETNCLEVQTIKTPTAVIGHRGTEYIVEVNNINRTEKFYLLEGEIEITEKNGKKTRLNSGEKLILDIKHNGQVEKINENDRKMLLNL